MEEKKKLKIAYALRPVVFMDDAGNKKIRYEKYHPISTGNAVVVGGKTLANKLKEYYDKDEVDALIESAGKVKSVNGKEGVVVITAQELGALTEHQDISGKQDVITDLETIRSGSALGATSIQEHQSLDGKQDVISDLETIRSGAALGATALQSVADATTDASGLMSKDDKSHVDAMWTMLDSDENEAAIDNWNEVKTFLASIDPNSKTLVALLNAKQDVIDDIAAIRSGAALGATSIQEHQSLDGKQDVIEDLDTIRSGASLGATALQEHQSLEGKQDKITEENKLSVVLISGLPEEYAPTDAQKNVQSDWNATEGDALILNKPTLFSGDYNDLENKPTIPSLDGYYDKDEVDELVEDSVENTVRTTTQTLSDDEKAIARNNIGAMGASDVDSAFCIVDGLVCQTFNE